MTLVETPVWLSRYTRLTAAATLFLVFAGAMVTSTGSGLAVPDWPLSYGMVFPPMVGGIFYEHGHRMIAATVGLLAVIQAIWLQVREPKRFVRRLGWISVLAVILQGVLGGITVLFLLPTAVSVAHAGLAEIFLCINMSIAFFTSRTFVALRGETVSSPQRTALLGSRAIVGLIYFQILIGALMRHLGAGLAIPDFPLSFGRLVPTISSLGVGANFSHRLGALVVTVAILALAPRALRSRSGAPRALYALMLLGLAVQLTLGAFTVWTGKQPLVTSLHVVTGASLLSLSVLFSLAVHAPEHLEQADRSIDLQRGEVPA